MTRHLVPVQVAARGRSVARAASAASVPGLNSVEATLSHAEQAVGTTVANEDEDCLVVGGECLDPPVVALDSDLNVLLDDVVCEAPRGCLQGVPLVKEVLLLLDEHRCRSGRRLVYHHGVNERQRFNLALGPRVVLPQVDRAKLLVESLELSMGLSEFRVAINLVDLGFNVGRVDFVKGDGACRAALEHDVVPRELHIGDAGAERVFALRDRAHVAALHLIKVAVWCSVFLAGQEHPSASVVQGNVVVHELLVQDSDKVN